MDDSEAAQQRVWARLPAGTREALANLSPSDLQTLLLSVARDRAARVRPAEVLRRWREDRFVRPSPVDPRASADVEASLWAALPDQFAAVNLSPVVPLGTCSAVGPVSQNRIVTTTRSVEVLSDSANALAVEAADRRLRSSAADDVHLATCHRLLRAQRFPSGYSSHFRLFTLVSSARDTGSAVTQARLLTVHLNYWRRVLAGLVLEAQIRVTVFDPALGERLATTALAPGQDGPVSIVEGPDRQRWEGYYVGAAFLILARNGTEWLEVGDGGLVTWTAQLMGNAKERCLVSCGSTERLATLSSDRSGPARSG